MANPDIYLLFGVARGGAVGGDSEKQIRSDLEDIINKINNDKLLKVKIGLDEKSVGSMKEQLETGLNLKGKKIAVKTELDTAALKGIQQQVSEMLTKLGETAASSESHLKGIVDLLSEINSKPFAANLNFSDANSGVESLGRYREAVRDYVREIREGHEAIAAIANHPLWKSNGLDDMFRSQIGALYGSGYDKEIPKFEKRLDASSSFAGVERVAKEALVYWKQLLPILTKAQEIGIISAESKFGVFPEIPKESVGVASQLVDLFTQITQKAQEAAAVAQPAAEQTAQALDEQRQAASAVSQEYEKQTAVMQTAAKASKVESKARAQATRDATAAEKEAAQNIEKSQKIYQQFVSILTKMRSALNGGETTMASTAYYAALNEQWLKLSGIISGCSGNAQEFGEYLKEAGIDAENTISEAATSLAEYKLALENMKPTIKAVAKEEERAAHDKADAERTAAEATKQRNKEQQAAASLNIKTERLYYSQLNAVRTMLLRVQNDLSRYSAAKTGRASGAYRELENQVEALKSMQGALISSGKPLDNFQKLMGSVRVNTKGASDAIVAARENTKSFADRFGGLASKFSMWFSATRVIMAVVRSIRQMISASVELDSALTQMQIVTKANTDEMEKFAQSASQSAKEIGSSISDFISSATTFARLGYDAEESSILARYTAMLQNVGDIDVSDAQDAITAIVKVFDVKMDDIESIMDRLVTVGNNFPISVSEIAEGMNNVSSAMHAAGNDFNQTVALLTASNTSVQNISKASTGLRTIAARIRNMKTELDDLGEAMTDAEYDKLVQALTDASVSLTDQQGNLRSTYDILADIAAVWDSIDPNKQAAIAETLSGTRQQNVYDSIIGQFQEATGAMEAMGKNSAGALQEAYEVFLNSIQGHLNQFKAAFESLSRSAAEGDFIKSIIDIGTKLIEILSSVSKLTNRIGGLNTALYTTASIIAVIKAEAIVTRLQRVADWFRAITTYVAQLKTVYKSFHSGQALVVQGTNNFSAALKGLGITASAAQLSVAGLAAAIGGLLIVINLVRQAQEKAQQQKVEAARAEAEAAEKAEENASNILGLYSAYQTAEKGTKDFRDASLELAKALNEEVSDGVTGVTEDLNELSEAALRAAHTSAITARDLAGSALVGEVSGRFTFGKQSNNLYHLADELPLHLTSNQKLNDLIKTTLYENRRDLSTAQGVSDYYKDLLSIKELIETINEEAGGESGFLDTKLYKSVTFALDDLKAEYEEYDTAVSREVRSDAMQYMFSVLRSGIIKTEDDFARWRQNVILASGKSIEFKKVLLELSADAFPDLVSEVEQTAGEIDDLYQRLTVRSENANNMDEALDGVVKAVQNFGDGTKEVYDAMAALEEKFPSSTAKLYDFETATLLVEAGLIADKASLLDFVDSNKQLEFSSAISELEKLADGYWIVAGAALAAMNAEAQAQMSRVIGFTTATTPSTSYDDYKNKLIAAIQSEKDEWDAWISGLRKRPDYTPKDTSSTKSEKEVDLELERLKSIVALRKEELSFLEASGDSTENQVAKMREIQKSLHDQAEHMRGVLSTMVAQGATQAEINAQAESILSLSTEWWKIQNDINELLHDDVDTISVYKDRISLLKAELDFMEARGDADSDRILKMREIQAALHEEAEAIRATEAYTKGEASALQSVVELGTEWWNLQNKIKELSEETLTNEKELLENMKSGMDKVLSLVIELIKKQKDDEVQALEDQKTAYRQIIDLRKKALDQSKTEAKYQKDIAKQLESMAELQRKINSLDLDDSREAQNEKAKLLKELEGLQESLAETQADHAIDAQEESLDKMQDAFEEEKDSEIKVVKDSVSSYQKLYDLAIDYIDKNWDSLYDDLIRWNTEYGSELNSTITSAWDECLKAAERYGSYVEALNHIDNDITNADTKSSSGTQRTIASYVAEMKQNSNEWNRRYNEGVAAGRDPAELRRELNNSDEIKRLHARNIEIMNILRGDPYNLPIEYDEAHGKYYIVENGVRNELYTKYPQYHSGGIVEGRPSAKQDEVLALLKNGETVLTERQGEAMYRIVDIFATLGDKLGKFIDGSRVKSIFASPLPQARFASAIDAINANGSGGTTIEHMEITAPIYVSEKLDEEDIRRHARTIGATAAEYIREGFTKRNVTGPVFGM